MPLSERADARGRAHLQHDAAMLLQEMGEYGAASALYARALEIEEAKLGGEHVDVAETVERGDAAAGGAESAVAMLVACNGTVSLASVASAAPASLPALAEMDEACFTASAI